MSAGQPVPLQDASLSQAIYIPPPLVYGTSIFYNSSLPLRVPVFEASYVLITPTCGPQGFVAGQPLVDSSPQHHEDFLSNYQAATGSGVGLSNQEHIAQDDTSHNIQGTFQFPDASTVSTGSKPLPNPKGQSAREQRFIKALHRIEGVDLGRMRILNKDERTALVVELSRSAGELLEQFHALQRQVETWRVRGQVWAEDWV